MFAVLLWFVHAKKSKDGTVAVSGLTKMQQSSWMDRVNPGVHVFLGLLPENYEKVDICASYPWRRR
jgi:hypothetical protein